jgi:hypothetical protein
LYKECRLERLVRADDSANDVDDGDRVDIGAVEWRWVIECDCWFDTDDDDDKDDDGDYDNHTYIWL